MPPHGAHEAYDFTPWLAEHLDILGAELGLTLEEVGQEVAVGPYFLDILAKAPGEDGGDVLVPAVTTPLLVNFKRLHPFSVG